ncbi:hypothetical protein KC19_4G004900 [Ceratodon purpureus]|uniref:Uncharacterized protein n=1 Tax=Ceratodon purpureus TaxID=3225 RepID=A0A8T0I524_CERPU|nr:hypothetical protein KC19_4G004900 [Ceratodon purpureus]
MLSVRLMTFSGHWIKIYSAHFCILRAPSFNDYKRKSARTLQRAQICSRISSGTNPFTYTTIQGPLQLLIIIHAVRKASTTLNYTLSNTKICLRSSMRLLPDCRGSRNMPVQLKLLNHCRRRRHPTAPEDRILYQNIILIKPRLRRPTPTAPVRRSYPAPPTKGQDTVSIKKPVSPAHVQISRSTNRLNFSHHVYKRTHTPVLSVATLAKPNISGAYLQLRQAKKAAPSHS